MPRREPREGFLQIQGQSRADELRLHYWDWDGGQPALLCVHGITANGRYWDTLAQRVAGRHRLVALDLRGRGLSDKPAAGNYGWEQHASDVAAAARALGVGPAIVVGHSLGGYVATLLAAREPALVHGLVVVDAGIDLDEATLRVQIGTSLKRLAMVFASREAYVEYWRQVPYLLWTPAFEHYLSADIEQRADGTVVSRTLAECVEEDLLYFFRPGRVEWFSRTARQVPAPAVVCWATDGLSDPRQPLMSRRGVEGLARLLPRARFVPIEGTNHYTILLAPAAVDRLVGEIEALVAPANSAR
ncbi:MAG TPA: alpha/beta hydrolase [Chloroflexota bacterium]